MLRLLMASLLFLAPPATVSQTVYGPGGLFVHPTAFIPDSKAARFNLSWFTQEAAGVESRWVPASLSFTPSPRAQVGALYVSRSIRGVERSSGGAFGKFQMLQGGVLSPSIAVAASFIGGDVQQSSITAVGSWRIPAARGLALHSGYQWMRRADLPVSADGFGRY